MSKKKQPKFAENLTFPHLFQPPAEEVRINGFQLSGKWNTDFFRNEHPLVLELGCGKGEYALELAQLEPGKNFIGIDIKGARLWRGSKTVKELGLKNVAFIRTNIEFADHFFSEGEVDEIWLTFSDPQPQKPRKRLTSPFFIERYRKFLRKGGLIHLKTDSRLLFNYTLEQISEHGYNLGDCTFNLYDTLHQFPEEARHVLAIKTFYEKMWLEKRFPINYLNFRIS